MFQSKESRPQWQIVYDHLRTMKIEDIVSDETLCRLLPGTPTGSVRCAFYRAAREMLSENLRAFDRVRKVGYRMVESREQERLALGQHRKATRSTKRAKVLASNVDPERLTQDERRRLSAIEDHLVRQADMMSRLSQRQLKTERQVARLDGRQALSEKDALVLGDRLDRLSEMLRRHGIEE
jgi:hypothetical protein